MASSSGCCEEDPSSNHGRVAPKLQHLKPFYMEGLIFQDICKYFPNLGNFEPFYRQDIVYAFAVIVWESLNHFIGRTLCMHL